MWYKEQRAWRIGQKAENGNKVSGVGFQVSGFSPADGLKSGQFNRKRNFIDSYSLLLIVGAVFNRD